MRRSSVFPKEKPWRKAEFISAAQVKSRGVPTGLAPWGIKGHAENPYNNRCDGMAVAGGEELLRLCDYHTVNTHWVKGHAENPYNNRCDEMAVAEWKKLK